MIRLIQYKKAGILIEKYMHSRCSDDGGFSPRELVGQCREHGVKIMAIAGHGYTVSDEEMEKELREIL